MTREDAKAEINRYEGVEVCIGRALLIDEIYDDFEKALKELESIYDKRRKDDKEAIKRGNK